VLALELLLQCVVTKHVLTLSVKSYLYILAECLILIVSGINDSECLMAQKVTVGLALSNGSLVLGL